MTSFDFKALNVDLEEGRAAGKLGKAKQSRRSFVSFTCYLLLQLLEERSFTE